MNTQITWYLCSTGQLRFADNKLRFTTPETVERSLKATDEESAKREATALWQQLMSDENRRVSYPYIIARSDRTPFLTN